MKKLLLELYEGDSHRAVRFRYGLLIFDVATILFLVGSSFVQDRLPLEIADAVIGIGIVADFSARLWISRHRTADLVNPLGIADVIVIISLLAPIIGEGLAFLRVARMFRLLRSYQLLKRLRQDFCCLKKFRARMEQTGELAVAELDDIDAAVNALIDEAVLAARAARRPVAAEVATDVYVNY